MEKKMLLIYYNKGCVITDYWLHISVFDFKDIFICFCVIILNQNQLRNTALDKSKVSVLISQIHWYTV